MTKIIGKVALAVLLSAPVAAYAQTTSDTQRPMAPPAASTAPPPYTMGESPDRPVNVPPPGITPEPYDDGLSARAKREADRVRCVPGAACETDGTFTNVYK